MFFPTSRLRPRPARRRFRTASLTGYQHSRFGSTALWEIIKTVNAARGVNFARDCAFNDPGGVTVSAEPVPGDTWLHGLVITEGDGRDFTSRGPRA
jgi:hypothetical protein